MELRSQKKRKEKEEYDELKITLSGRGLFEEQMELKEMQDIMQALQMSEACVKEKENHLQPFVHPNENMLNSTMIDSYGKRQLSSPESSPEPHFLIHTVKAIVHHSMDWSPFRDSSLLNNNSQYCSSMRKRNSEQDIIENSHEAAKRLRYDSIINADSGINLSISTSSSRSSQKIDAAGIDGPLMIVDSSTTTEAIKTEDGLLKLHLEKQCTTKDKEVSIDSNTAVGLTTLCVPESSLWSSSRCLVSKSLD